ncbi:MAG TPA: DUF5916 domain-containing protein, partial [Cyclobacteriaceae bacterium]|nr:DUF5916 domain-containing protein [Cyclobacteriaceae bacterium]
VCFDSYFDHRTGFEFDLTAAGSKIDLILLNNRWDTNWNPVWYGKVGMEDSAWVAEFQIPLSQLRYGNAKEHTWGLHSWRWINRYQEEDQWNLIRRDGPGHLYSIGELHGVNGITMKRKLELLPYLVGKYRTYPREVGNPYSSGSDKKFSVGLDGKAGLSSDFTLDFTINPDFGQVEADPSVLNLSAFEVFYDEKRPFFLEGKNILDFNFGGGMLFYSRRIGHAPMAMPELDEDEYSEPADLTPILGAVKITGKTKNGLSIGIMESLTDRKMIGITTPGKIWEQAAEPMTNYFVTRVQKDIHEGNTLIGGMLTATNRFLNDSNLYILNRSAYTGGIDFRHHWKNKTYFIDFKSVFSNVSGENEAMLGEQTSSARYFQRPDADYVHLDSAINRLAGNGGSVRVGKGSNGKWRYSAGIYWRTPGLELNDIGYSQESDMMGQEISVGYLETVPRGIFREYSAFFEQSRAWNFGGINTNSEYSLNWRSVFTNKWRLNASWMRFSAAYDPRLLRGGPSVWMKGFWHNRYSINTDPSRKLAFEYGIHFHFFDDQVSTSWQTFTEISYRPANSLRLSVDADYLETGDNYQYVGEIQSSAGPRYIFSFLQRETLALTFRVNYALTPDFTIQYYGNPYFSLGDYGQFKYVCDSRSKQLEDIYHIYSSSEILLNPPDNCYYAQENSQAVQPYSFDNPDFNFTQFRSNLVARWEYKPGSTLYLVWTHGQSQYVNVSRFSMNDNFGNMFNIPSDNIFLLKLSYWFQI